MAYREVPRMEIREVIRRWQAGVSQGRIVAGAGLSRNTARKYLAAAKADGIVRDGPMPSEEQLTRLAAISQWGPRQVDTPGQDLLEPWADQIYQWLTGDRLLMTRIHELLLARGCSVSYPSLRRFMVKRNWRKGSKATVRMEDTPPGEVAEADFGRLGMITDPATGKRKAVWAMVIVLCHSRHCFVWPMRSHQLEDVIAGLETAWAFFGGMPKYLVIDNFPAAVAGADPLHPHFTQGFLEYAQHRGFIPDPARKSHPQDKPKVERGRPTSGSVSSRALNSMTSPTCVPPRRNGAWRWPVSASTAPRGRNHWWFSRMRSATPCFPGMASPTKSPSGAPIPSIRTTTSSAGRRCTRCRLTCAARVGRWRSEWTASWSASTTVAS